MSEAATAPANFGPGAASATTAAAPTPPGQEGAGAAPEQKVEQAAPLTLDDPKPVETPPPDEAVEVVYEPTGDSGLDVALTFVGQRGFGPEHPSIVAATQGNFDLLEADLKKLGDKAKGYGVYIQAAKDSFARSKATGEAVLQEVTQAVGGAPRWNAIIAWAKENADPTERKEINAAFAAGRLSAVAMARELSNAFKASGKDVAPAASALKPGAARSEGTSALSPAQYKQELANLEKKYGNRMQFRPEFAELTARRRAYQG